MQPSCPSYDPAAQPNRPSWHAVQHKPTLSQCLRHRNSQAVSFIPPNLPSPQPNQHRPKLHRYVQLMQIIPVSSPRRGSIFRHHKATLSSATLTAISWFCQHNPSSPTTLLTESPDISRTKTAKTGSLYDLQQQVAHGQSHTKIFSSAAMHNRKRLWSKHYGCCVTPKHSKLPRR